MCSLCNQPIMGNDQRPRPGYSDIPRNHKVLTGDNVSTKQVMFYRFKAAHQKLFRAIFVGQHIKALKDNVFKNEIVVNVPDTVKSDINKYKNVILGRKNNFIVQPPAIDYRDNYWIPPYEIPQEPNYFPGYNIETVWPVKAFYGTPSWSIPN